MRKQFRFLIVMSIAMAAGLGFSQQTEQPSLPPPTQEPSRRIIDVRNANCPVSGNPVQDEWAVHADKLYHFCRPTCVEAFQDNPQAWISKIKDAKEMPLTLANFQGDLPINCPISGKPAIKRVFTVQGTSITFFCCADCLEKARKAEPSLGSETIQGQIFPTGDFHYRFQGSHVPPSTKESMVETDSSANPHGSAGSGGPSVSGHCGS